MVFTNYFEIRNQTPSTRQRYAITSKEICAVCMEIDAILSIRKKNSLKMRIRAQM